jgi:predicted nucleotidyltransferase
MQSRSPLLLPVLRSPLQAAVLTRLLLEPDRAESLSDLARATGVSVATVQREVERAESAGLLASERIGATRLVRADTTSPLFKPLADLLLIAFGPLSVVTDVLAGIEGIEEAYLFGSWAARYTGTPGRAPNDVDVLVIGHPEREAIHDAAEQAERTLARPVQITIRSPRAWKRAEDDPFLREVRARPLVPIPLADAE